MLSFPAMALTNFWPALPVRPAVLFTSPDAQDRILVSSPSDLIRNLERSL